jgi:hypothetical protein
MRNATVESGIADEDLILDADLFGFLALFASSNFIAG